jgi:hypothetical protein
MTTNTTTTAVVASTTACPATLGATDTEAVIDVGAGTFAGVTGKVQVSRNGTDYFDWPFYDVHGVFQDAGATITLSDSTAAYLGRVPGLQGMTAVRFKATGWTSGSAPVSVTTGVYGTSAGVPAVPGGGNGSFSSVTSSGLVKSTSPTAGVGYATGAGGTVTQITSRTTGVTLNTVSGNIVLFSAAGSATPFSFTLTNSAIAAGDTVILNQKSGTDKYTTQVVTAVAAGSCQVTLANASGTTTEQPVFNFNVIKGVAA